MLASQKAAELQLTFGCRDERVRTNMLLLPQRLWHKATSRREDTEAGRRCHMTFKADIQATCVTNIMTALEALRTPV